MSGDTESIPAANWDHDRILNLYITNPSSDVDDDSDNGDNNRIQSGPERSSGTTESANTLGGAGSKRGAKSKMKKRVLVPATKPLLKPKSAGTSRANTPRAGTPSLDDQLAKLFQEQLQSPRTPSSPNPFAGRPERPRTSSRPNPHVGRPATASPALKKSSAAAAVNASRSPIRPSLLSPPKPTTDLARHRPNLPPLNASSARGRFLYIANPGSEDYIDEEHSKLFDSQPELPSSLLSRIHSKPFDIPPRYTAGLSQVSPHLPSRFLHSTTSHKGVGSTLLPSRFPFKEDESSSGLDSDGSPPVPRTSGINHTIDYTKSSNQRGLLSPYWGVIEALARFHTYISPWDSPHEWNNAYDCHLRSTWQALARLVGNDELREAYISSHMIYPGLIVYLFIQLTACAANGKTGFEDTLKTWRTWDDITVFEMHQQIKEYLTGMFVELKRLNSAVHTRETFETLLALDVVNFSAQLTVLLMDDDRYKILVKRREEAAQALLNILQARLDYTIESRFKPRYLKTLAKLSQLSRKYPECLLLEDNTLPSFIPVAGGKYGDVYKGSMAGCDVAIKVLKVYSDSGMARVNKDFGRFAREAVIWRQLSHPNVLPFYGVFRLKCMYKRLCLVSPWMNNRNLSEYLSKTAPEADCVLLALDVVQGLEYLHGQNVVHADLKCANILVSDACRACLADFGLSIANDPQSVLVTAGSSTGGVGTPAWTAPELLLHETKRPDEACDVYSFSMVCYEMFSGCIPFQGKSGPHVIIAICLSQRPERPVDPRSHRRGLTDRIWEIIATCWHQKPEERFTAGQAVQRLSNLPDRPSDNRSADDFSMPPPSRAMYRQAHHPFSILEIISEQETTGTPCVPGSISQIFGLADSWDEDVRRSK